MRRDFEQHIGQDRQKKKNVLNHRTLSIPARLDDRLRLRDLRDYRCPSKITLLDYDSETQACKTQKTCGDFKRIIVPLAAAFTEAVFFEEEATTEVTDLREEKRANMVTRALNPIPSKDVKNPEKKIIPSRILTS